MESLFSGLYLNEWQVLLLIYIYPQPSKAGAWAEVCKRYKYSPGIHGILISIITLYPNPLCIHSLSLKYFVFDSSSKGQFKKK